MSQPAIGDRVLVRPSQPNHRVQRLANMYGQFLQNDWQEATWDDWLHCRFRDGSIEWKSINEEVPAEIEIHSAVEE